MAPSAGAAAALASVAKRSSGPSTSSSTAAVTSVMFDAGVTLVGPAASNTGTPSTPTTGQLPGATWSPVGTSDATSASLASAVAMVPGCRRSETSGVTTWLTAGVATGATGSPSAARSAAA